MTRAEAYADLIQLFCGKPPPFLIEESVSKLSDVQTSSLQDFLASHVKLQWLTGIGILEALDQLVDEALANSVKAFEEARPWFAKPMYFGVRDAVRFKQGRTMAVGIVTWRSGRRLTVRGMDGISRDISSLDIEDVLNKKHPFVSGR